MNPSSFRDPSHEAFPTKTIETPNDAKTVTGMIGPKATEKSRLVPTSQTKEAAKATCSREESSHRSIFIGNHHLTNAPRFDLHSNLLQ
jgi:hypothetical protein